MKNPTRHSERRRSPLFWALVEFGRLSEAWLAAPKSFGWCRVQILRATVRATTAFSHASEGRSKKRHVERIRVAMTDCEAAFILLDGKLSSGVVREAIRRIDQIRAALDELVSIDVDKWPDVALPTLETGENDEIGIWPALQRIAESVVAMVPRAAKKKPLKEPPPDQGESDETKRAA
jgi:hypothetical protein